MAQRVLLVGKRAALLKRLQQALGEAGIQADLTQQLDQFDARASELPVYDAVVFGQAVPAADRARAQAVLSSVHPQLAVVESLAPITPLVVAQVQQALDRRPARLRRLAEIEFSQRHLSITLRVGTAVRVIAYRLTRLHRARYELICAQEIPVGRHDFLIPPSMEHSPAVFAAAYIGDEVYATGRTNLAGQKLRTGGAPSSQLQHKELHESR